MKKFTAVFCAFAISILSLIAQSDTTFFNKGAAVFIKPGAIFHVNGNVVNSGASALFENKGTVEVENSINKGNFSFKTGSNIQGNGDFYIEGDWINNANFFTDATNNNSYVNLNGGNQLITGSNPSVFYDLELSGIGIKTQTINATVSNTLTLNDRELATQTNTMFVTNTAVNAVTNTQTFGSEGFVSSTGNGSLSRQTATPSAYLFPLGSSTGTKRYRAVEVTPATNNPNTFTGSFVNNDPTADGFNKDSVDAILCKVNDKYYHKLRRTNGGDAADLTFYYLPADGNFEALAQWGTPAVTVWNNLGTVSATTGVYNSLKKAAWGDFSTQPFALSNFAPLPPVITGIATICTGDTGTQFNVLNPDSGVTYTWSVPSGAVIVSGQGTDSIVVDWGANGGPVTVIQTNNLTGCSSAASQSPWVVNQNPVPVAGFDTVNGGFFNDYLTFIDTSFGATSWTWDFGDGDTAMSQNPAHQYQTGDYTVTLIVENSFGCKDTTIILLSFGEGILIPNVFSPNGDGMNDYFYIPSLGVNEFDITIYNRWGTEMWRSNASKIEWDGKSASGQDVPDGTYYYVLNAKSTAKDYSRTGFITLVR